MRQRRIKNLESKYAAYADLLVYVPAGQRGRWRERSAGRPLELEIGCGKGRFLAELAARQPERFFVGIEGHRSVLLRTLEKVRERGLSNVLLIPEYVADVRDWFAPGEVAGIYLNFSDPLPKPAAARKRLTHRSKLRAYFAVMEPEGWLRFRTDSNAFFDFSIREARAADLHIAELTRDLYSPGDEGEAKNTVIETEYEQRFRAQHVPIKSMELRRRPDSVRETSWEREKGEQTMMKMAAENGRTIPKEDKVFGISGRASAAVREKGADRVINATVGALLDDAGKLIVLSSVDEAVRALRPEEYAAYAPIAGTPAFRAAIQRAALGTHQTQRHVAVVAAPGGTGAIRNAVDNYSCPGDKILSHDWCWPNYRSIADELGRAYETFAMFTADGRFNIEDFAYKVHKLLRVQDRLVIILNSPANNPTGYALSREEWAAVVDVLNKTPENKRVALVLDVAYIDFAGEEAETRCFLPEIERLQGNVLPMLAYSTSKTFTFYGFRCAALICLAGTEAVAEEFVQANAYACRSTWSNAPHAPQAVIERIYADADLLARVDAERRQHREMLLARGRAFAAAAAEAGLEIVPFRAGFFVSVPCEDPDAVSAVLEGMDAYCVPMAKGVRVSIASISEAKCRRLPAMMRQALDEVAARG